MNKLNTDIIRYYSDRAHEYERVYQKPERENELRILIRRLQNEFNNKDITEIACGAGFWTQHIALTAKAIIACDINTSMLDIAQMKHYPSHNVTFHLCDLYSQSSLCNTFEGLFGGFIWSHIALTNLPCFLKSVQRKVKPGGRVVFIDNTHVAGSSTPISETDDDGNTFQQRTLDNGERYLILKNYPTAETISSLLKTEVNNLVFEPLTNYWILSYDIL